MSFLGENAQSDTSFPCLPQTLESQCIAGRGNNYIEHGGYTWRALDGADPQGARYDDPNGGCQCTGTATSSNNWNECAGGNDNYLPLPAGGVLAPNDATSIAVVAAHGWSTNCVVLADGTGWVSANLNAGAYCGGGFLATSGGTYTVTRCQPSRVLIRCS